MCPASILAWCRAPQMCKNEHTMSTNAHTRKHTTSCAKPSRHDNPAFTPLHAHLAFVFSFPPSPLPLIRTGMSTSVDTLGCGRGPHLAPRRLLRTHAFQKTCQNAGTSSCLWLWVGLVLAAWPHSVWRAAFRLGCFWQARVSIFGFSPCPESSSRTGLLSIGPLCSERGGASVL